MSRPTLVPLDPNQRYPHMTPKASTRLDKASALKVLKEVFPEWTNGSGVQLNEGGADESEFFQSDWGGGQHFAITTERGGPCSMLFNYYDDGCGMDRLIEFGDALNIAGFAGFWENYNSAVIHWIED